MVKALYFHVELYLDLLMKKEQATMKTSLLDSDH